MDQWYCKEFIHSSQTALRLVFNVENCLDLDRVIDFRPARPPDSVGRESFVYIMTGENVRNIRDLAIDDLTPWNSKSCKSSTRFNAIQLDSSNNVFLRRYIISDSNEKPEHLLACYYCKHPIFKLTKKIFYACDGRRERCLPGTFVLFTYEFEEAQTLYPTRRFFNVGSSGGRKGQGGQHNSNSNSLENAPLLQLDGPQGQGEDDIGAEGMGVIGGEEVIEVDDDYNDSGGFQQQLNSGNSQRPINGNSLSQLIATSSTSMAGNRGGSRLMGGGKKRLGYQPSMLPSSSNNAYGSGGGGSFDEAYAFMDGSGGGGEEMGFSGGNNNIDAAGLEELLRFSTNTTEEGSSAGIGSGVSRVLHSIPVYNCSRTYDNNNSSYQQQQEPPRRKRPRKTSTPVAAFSFAHKFMQQNEQQEGFEQKFSPTEGGDGIMSLNSPHFASDGVYKEADGNSFAEQSSIPARYVHIMDELLENFRVNGLCDGADLALRLEDLEERFVELTTTASSTENRGREEALGDLVEQFQAQNGGCLMEDEPIPLLDGERFLLTPIWFRNPTFRQNGHPVIHPIAFLLSDLQQLGGGSGTTATTDDLQFLLVELQTKINGTTLSGACRSFLSLNCQIDGGTEQMGSSEGGATIDILEGPCIRIVWPEKLKELIHQKLSNHFNLAPEAVERIKRDLFGSDKSDRAMGSKEEEIEKQQLNVFIVVKNEEDQQQLPASVDEHRGILDSLTFEEFVRRLRVGERNWPAGAFRVWLREKSGWLFQRCSRAAWVKAGFASFGDEVTRQEINEARDIIKSRLDQALLSGGEEGEPMGFNFEQLLSTLDEFCEEMLVKSARALFNTLENGGSSPVPDGQQTCQPKVTLSPFRSELALSRSDWTKLSYEEKISKLASLGLSSLQLLDSIADSLDPRLFIGLSRQEKNEIRAEAALLDVIRLDQRTLPHRFPAIGNAEKSGENVTTAQNPIEFVVVNVPMRQSHYVSIFSRKVDEEIDRIEAMEQKPEELSETTATTIVSVFCQCQSNENAGGDLTMTGNTAAKRLCPHLCAVALTEQSVCQLIINAIVNFSTSTSNGMLKDYSVKNYSFGVTDGMSDNNHMNIYNGTKKQQNRSLLSGLNTGKRSISTLEVIRCSSSPSGSRTQKNRYN